MRLNLISAGAAQAVVQAMADAFRTETGGGEVAGSFGAVGAMREKLAGGAPCDVIILTRAMIDRLATEGRVLPDTRADLGKVRTGVAVLRDAPRPKIDTPDALRTCLLAASAIYFPDPQKATAGIHFARVLDNLGLLSDVSGRLRSFPNGAAAMRAMAEANDPAAVGCTQITEILATDGVTLVAPLPREFELATVYTAAVCSEAESPNGGRLLIGLLTAENSRALRTKAGFEV